MTGDKNMDERRADALIDEMKAQARRVLEAATAAREQAGRFQRDADASIARAKVRGRARRVIEIVLRS